MEQGMSSLRKNLPPVYLVLALAAVTAAVAILWDGDEDRIDGASRAGPTESGSQVLSGERLDRKDADLPESSEIEDAAEREKIIEKGIVLAGRVTDKATGEPVTAFDFMLREYMDGMFPGYVVIHETVRHAEGKFRFHLAKAGKYVLNVISSVHRETCIKELDVPEPSGVADLEVQLDPGLWPRGKVIDESTGEPVANALVLTTQWWSAHPMNERGYNWTHTPMLVQLGKSGASCPNTRTDEEGRFLLSGLYERSWDIVAVHPDYALGAVKREADTGDGVEIFVTPGYRVSGTVRDDSGKLLPGVLIEISGDLTRLKRPALTDGKGRYRTAPMKSGEVRLHAGPPFWDESPGTDFTPETKSAILVDKDLEINFGLLPGHVRWTGTCHDFDGTPLKNAVIDLSPDRSSPWPPGLVAVPRRSTSDENGRFEFTKLLEGRYKVEIGLSRWSSDIPIETVTLPSGEHVEQDLRLPGGAIRGTFIDGTTGKPVSRTGTIYARGKRMSRNSPASRKTRSSRIGPEGRFFLKGLEEGLYWLEAQIQGYANKTIQNVEMRKDQFIDDFEIIIFQGGTLRIQLRSFLPLLKRDIGFTIQKDGEIAGACRLDLDENGNCDESYLLEAGRYAIHLEIEGIGVVTRDVEIFPNATANLIFEKDAIETAAKRVDVTGTLTFPDGSPVAGKTVVLEPIPYPGMDDSYKDTKWIKTDENGCFSAEGLRHGMWWPLVMEGNAKRRYPYLVIPSDAESPRKIDLLLPRGRVRGTILDGRTGYAFLPDGPSWMVSIRALGERISLCSDQGRQPPQFDLFGIPEGNYRLTAKSTEDHAEFISKPFFLAEGGTLDLGVITLGPTGCLLLRIIDSDGEPVKGATIMCSDRELPRDRSSGRLSGRFQYEGLPFGKYSLVIKAKGFREAALTVDLQAGHPGEELVVLERDE